MRTPLALDVDTGTNRESPDGQPSYLDFFAKDLVWDDEDTLLLAEAENQAFLEAVKTVQPPARFHVAKPKQKPKSKKGGRSEELHGWGAR